MGKIALLLVLAIGASAQYIPPNTGGGGGGTGTVTNADPLTTDLPVFGAGVNSVAIGAKTGSGNTLVTSTGPTITTATLISAILGTPTSGTATNITGLPISTGVSGLGTGVGTFLVTPSSANLAAAVTGETGAGALVFANTPTLITPEIGAATGVSLALTGGMSTGGATNTCDGTAGCVQFGQGTAPSGQATTGIQEIAPTSVTSYRVTKPGAAATGFKLWTNSSNVVTETLVASNGSGNVLLSAGTAAIASGKTLTVSNTMTQTATDSSTVAFGAGGTAVKIIASGATALDFASTATGACATVITAAATGVASTDSIIFNANASIKAVTGYVPASTGGFSVAAYPTTNTINFEACNWTAGTVDPGSITVNWLVVRTM